MRHEAESSKGLLNVNELEVSPAIGKTLEQLVTGETMFYLMKKKHVS